MLKKVGFNGETTHKSVVKSAGHCRAFQCQAEESSHLAMRAIHEVGMDG